MNIDALTPGSSRLRVIDDATELRLLIECYQGEGGMGLDPRYLAGKLCLLLGLPETEEDFSNWDGTVMVQLLEGGEGERGGGDVGEESLENIVIMSSPFFLPLASFASQEDGEDAASTAAALPIAERKVVRDRASEVKMIQTLAAESIQDAFRRYRECRAAVKSLHINKSQRIVMGLAADTIKSGIKRAMLHRKAASSSSLSKPSSEDVVAVAVKATATATAAVAIEGDDSSAVPVPPPLAAAAATTAKTRVRAKKANANSSSASSVPSPTATTDAAATTTVAASDGNGSGNNNRENEEGDVKAAAIAAAAAASVDWDMVDLPPGWERRFDNAKNKSYYVDHNTKCTQWKHPLYVKESGSSGGGGGGGKKRPSTAQASSSSSSAQGGQNIDNTKSKASRPSTSTQIRLQQQQQAAKKETASLEVAAAAATSPALALALEIVGKKHEEVVKEQSELHNAAVAAVAAAEALAAAKAAEAAGGNKSSNGLTRKDSKGSMSLGNHSATTTVGTTTNRQSSSSPLTLPPVTAPITLPPRLLLDEAFSRAISAECSTIQFTAQEAAILLDALGCELVEPISELNLDDIKTPIDLPMLHAASLAAVLTSFAKEHRLVTNHRAFCVSEEKAAVAVKRLKSLVEGPWRGTDKARMTILQSCAGNQGRLGRPSFWPLETTKGPGGGKMQRLAKVLGFPDAPFAELSGQGFLETNKKETKTLLNLTPSLLQVRFAVYQHTLRLIDQWWDKGHRPEDFFKEVSGAALGAMLLPFSAGIANNNNNANSNAAISNTNATTSQPVAATAATSVVPPAKNDLLEQESRKKAQDAKLAAAMVEANKKKKAKKSKGKGKNGVSRSTLPTSPTKWGQVVATNPLSSSASPSLSSSTLSQRTYVEIAPLEALLQAWVPLNRAYGWGVPLEALTSLGGKLGGTFGHLVVNHPDLDDVKGCRWVTVGESSDEKNVGASTLSFPYLDAFKSANGIVRLASPLSSTSAVQAERGRKGEAAAAISSSSSSSPSYNVLVPLFCLRIAAEPNRRQLQHGGVLCPEDVHVGLVIKVVSEDALTRACERFDWWDRPPPDAIRDMAGQKGEVVSLSELHSKMRVGVRMLETDLFDALPLEALLPNDEELKSALQAKASQHKRTERERARSAPSSKSSMPTNLHIADEQRKLSRSGSSGAHKPSKRTLQSRFKLDVSEGEENDEREEEELDLFEFYGVSKNKSNSERSASSSAAAAAPSPPNNSSRASFIDEDEADYEQVHAFIFEEEEKREKDAYDQVLAFAFGNNRGQQQGAIKKRGVSSVSVHARSPPLGKEIPSKSWEFVEPLEVGFQGGAEHGGGHFAKESPLAHQVTYRKLASGPKIKVRERAPPGMLSSRQHGPSSTSIVEAFYLRDLRSRTEKQQEEVEEGNEGEAVGNEKEEEDDNDENERESKPETLEIIIPGIDNNRRGKRGEQKNTKTLRGGGVEKKTQNGRYVVTMPKNLEVRPLSPPRIAGFCLAFDEEDAKFAEGVNLERELKDKKDRVAALLAVKEKGKASTSVHGPKLGQVLLDAPAPVLPAAQLAFINPLWDEKAVYDDSVNIKGRERPKSASAASSTASVSAAAAANGKKKARPLGQLLGALDEGSDPLLDINTPIEPWVGDGQPFFLSGSGPRK